MPNIIDNARNLRKNSTEAEKLLWSRLRDRRLNGLKFKRQHPFPPYIVDFFCEECALVIELDGGQHNGGDHKESDKTRTAFLNEKGVTVLRFWNNDVLKNVEGVLETIASRIPSPKSSPQGRGLDDENDLSLDKGFASKRILIGEIATAHGIKGLVKVRGFVDDETLLESGKVFTDETSNKTIELTLKNVLKGDWLAEVKGVSDRNAAELLRGTQLYIDRNAMPEPDDGEYYFEDLKGMKVVDKDGKEIGVILGIENFGASDLLDIKPAAGQNFYLPFTDGTVLDVDMDAGRVTVEIPEAI